MKISLITVTYNSESTIAETIDSVLGQNYSDLEYIIVDGKSTDRTTEIITSFKDGITKFISEPDSGLYDALNKGISMATGDIIGFIHSDDQLAGNDILQAVGEAFETFGTDSIYGDLVYVDKNDPLKVVRHWISGNYDRKKIAKGWMPPHPTFYVKREIYMKYGGFDTSYRISADYDFMVRMLHKNGISAKYIPIIMVKMRLGGESNRSVGNIFKKTREDIRSMRSNGLHFIPGILRKNLSKLGQLIPSARINREVEYIHHIS
jgi:glycosyltransferase